MATGVTVVLLLLLVRLPGWDYLHFVLLLNQLAIFVINTCLEVTQRPVVSKLIQGLGTEQVSSTSHAITHLFYFIFNATIDQIQNVLLFLMVLLIKLRMSCCIVWIWICSLLHFKYWLINKLGSLPANSNAQVFFVTERPRDDAVAVIYKSSYNVYCHSCGISSRTIVEYHWSNLL